MNDSVLVYYVLFPALIFLARMADVTLGTLRIIMVSRGLKNIAPIVGFFEVLIWLLAIRQIMMNLTEVSYFLAYAGGLLLVITSGCGLRKGWQWVIPLFVL